MLFKGFINFLAILGNFWAISVFLSILSNLTISGNFWAISAFSFFKLRVPMSVCYIPNRNWFMSICIRLGKNEKTSLHVLFACFKKYVSKRFLVCTLLSHHKYQLDPRPLSEKRTMYKALIHFNASIRSLFAFKYSVSFLNIVSRF